MVHLISSQKENPEADFKHIVKNLFSLLPEEGQDEKAKILCSCYFSIPDSNGLDVKDIPKNVFLCPGADLDLDYDQAIKKVNTITYMVKKIVAKLFYYIKHNMSKHILNFMVLPFKRFYSKMEHSK